MQALPGINHALHLVSAVLWIGALGFIIMSLTPSLRGKFPHEHTKILFQEIRNRYYRMGWVFLTILLVTGGLNAHFAIQDMGEATQSWVIVLGIKLFLVTCFGSLFLLNVLYKSNSPESTETAIPFAKASLILGLLIIVSAALLRHIH